MSRSSWLDDEKTVRRYPFPDGSAWVVQNEYQPIDCSECGGTQYLRLTHIWHLAQDGLCTPEYHVNRRDDLEELKSLLVSYTGPDQTPVREVEIDGKWTLLVGEKVVSQAE